MGKSPVIQLITVKIHVIDSTLILAGIRVCSYYEQIEHKSLTLGEVLDGDRMALSQYELHFKGELFKSCFCSVWLLC